MCSIFGHINFSKDLISKSKFIDENKHHILKSKHPSPLSANRGGWFGCQHFIKTNEILKSLNKKQISW